MKIVVLMGGASDEREVSLSSGAGIARALRGEGHEVIAVDTVRGALGPDEEAALLEGGLDPDPPSRHELENLDPGTAVAIVRQPDYADVDVFFVALHGGSGEDGTIQALLETIGVAYTGSGVLASSLAMDKELSKCIFRDLGVPTPEGFVVHAGTSLSEIAERVAHECGYPVVVKPNAQGSSVGVSIVPDESKLAAAVECAATYDERLVFERFIPGREVTVAVVEGRALPVVEIVPQSGMYDYRSKYTPGSSTYHVPADLPETVASLLQQHALRCFNGLRCRDFARVDFRVTPAHEPYCLEVNTIPGMTPTSLVPKAAAAIGTDFETLVEGIVRAAAARGPVRSNG